MAFSSVKIENLLGMITVKLKEDNFVKWDYQFQSVLKGYDLFDFFNGESQCPPKFIINADTGVTKELATAYKEWVKTYIVEVFWPNPISVAFGSSTQQLVSKSRQRLGLVRLTSWRAHLKFGIM